MNEAESGVLFYVWKKRKEGFRERGADLLQQPWADSIYAGNQIGANARSQGNCIFPDRNHFHTTKKKV